MANETGRQTINELSLLECDTDPVSTGMPGSTDIGDLLLVPFQPGLYQRVGGGSTAIRRLDRSTTGTVQATAATTTILTNVSNFRYVFTGTTAGQIVRLPNATTLENFHEYMIQNRSTQNITVQDNAAATVLVVGAEKTVIFSLSDNTTSSGVWRPFSEGVAGNYLQVATDAAETSTTSTVTYSTKLTITTPSLPVGNYYATFQMRMRVNNANRNAQVQMTDNAGVLFDCLPFIPNVAGIHIVNGFYLFSGISGAHTINVDFRVGGAGGTTVFMSSAQLAFWRIS